MGKRACALAALLALGWLFTLTLQARAECSVESVWDCQPPPPPGGHSPVPIPPLPTTTTTQPPPRPDANAAADRLFVLINGERTARGLSALSRRADVDRIAKEHGERMAAAYRIWHNDDYFTPLTKRLIGASFVGENVAKNSAVDDMHRRLMLSPPHRDNILDGRFTAVGIGVGVAPNGELFATEDFMTPAAAAAPVAAPVKAKPAPSTTTTTEPPPSPPAPEAEVELAMPGPMDMVGAALPAPARPGEGRPWLWLLAGLAAIAAPLAVGFGRYHHA